MLLERAKEKAPNHQDHLHAESWKMKLAEFPPVLNEAKPALGLIYADLQRFCYYVLSRISTKR
jgi:hypothetical protein